MKIILAVAFLITTYGCVKFEEISPSAPEATIEIKSFSPLQVLRSNDENGFLYKDFFRTNSRFISGGEYYLTFNFNSSRQFVSKPVGFNPDLGYYMSFSVKVQNWKKPAEFWTGYISSEDTLQGSTQESFTGITIGYDTGYVHYDSVSIRLVSQGDTSEGIRMPNNVFYENWIFFEIWKNSNTLILLPGMFDNPGDTLGLAGNIKMDYLTIGGKGSAFDLILNNMEVWKYD
ncbi:MAG: hypothetical protein ACLFQK_06650 [Fibrobacterota bacterium]